MASVTGSQLAFFAAGQPGSNVNIVLTSTGSGLPTAVTGKFNIEVFTATPAAGFSLAPGYDASAFIQDAVQLNNNEVKAGTLSSTEQLLAGSYLVIDRTGGEKIQIVGSTGTTNSSISVVGSIGDTITGSTVSGVTQFIDARGTNADANPGPMTVIGGADLTTIMTGVGD